MRYKRNFITLKSNNSSRSNALGKSILESHGEKGKISISVQNLKSQCIYYAFIVVGGTHINIGNIATDKRGRGDVKVDLSTDNLSINLEEIEKIVITEKGDSIVILIGEIGRSIKQEESRSESKVAAIAAEEKLETSATFPATEETLYINDTKDKEITPINDLHKEESDVIDSVLETMVPKEIDNNNPTEELSEQLQNLSIVNESKKEVELPTVEGSLDTHQQESLSHKQLERRLDAETPIERNTINFVHNVDLNNIFLNNPKIMPFKKQSKDFKWVKITLKETIYLPINFWSLVNDPFVVSCYKKHNHIILGECDAVQKEYLLGIPDTFSQKNKARANGKGFVQFKCCEDVLPKENESGYWIMPVYIV